MTTHYDEKRDFIRMPVDCNVTFSLAGDSQQYYGKGTDLSAEGVMFLSVKELQVGEKITIQVHPYIKTILPLSASAEVVRSTKSDDGFIIGVRMEQVS